MKDRHRIVLVGLLAILLLAALPARAEGPQRAAAAGQRRRAAARARPGTAPLARGVHRGEAEGRGRRPGLSRALRQGDRARLVPGVRRAGPALPGELPRRPGPRPGADRRDDGTGAGGAVRRGTQAVPGADERAGQARAGGVRRAVHRLARPGRQYGRCLRRRAPGVRNAPAALRREPDPAAEGQGRPESAGDGRQAGSPTGRQGRRREHLPARRPAGPLRPGRLLGDLVRPVRGRAAPSPGRLSPSIARQASRSSASASTRPRRPSSTSPARASSPGARSTTPVAAAISSKRSASARSPPRSCSTPRGPSSASSSAARRSIRCSRSSSRTRPCPRSGRGGEGCRARGEGTAKTRSRYVSLPTTGRTPPRVVGIRGRLNRCDPSRLPLLLALVAGLLDVFLDELEEVVVVGGAQGSGPGLEVVGDLFVEPRDAGRGGRGPLAG